MRLPTIHRRIAAGCALLLALGASLSGDTPQLPFVSNNGFDIWRHTDQGDWPVDWARAKGASWHREEGRAFLRLTQTEPGKLIMIYRDFVVPPDVKAFRVDATARAADIVPGDKAWFDARIILQFMNDSKAKIKGGPGAIVIARKGTTDWKEISKKFSVPEGATRIECMICLFQVQSGSMDIDLFNLEPINPDELAAK